MSSEENANGDLSIVTLPRMHAVDDQVLAGVKSSSSMQQNESLRLQLQDPLQSLHIETPQLPTFSSPPFT
jgi:hypothetical protein